MSNKVQLKVSFPKNLYNDLKRHSEITGVTMASLVRLAVADRYQPQDAEPVPYQVTEKGQRARNNC